MNRAVLVIMLAAVLAGSIFAGPRYKSYQDDARQIIMEPAQNPFFPPLPESRPQEVDMAHSFSPMGVDTLPPCDPYLGRPTYKAGNTYYEMQHNTTKGRMIAVDTAGGVHVAWMDGVTPTFTQRVVKYNYFHIDSVGTSIYPEGWLCDDYGSYPNPDGNVVHATPYAGYTNISVDDAHTVPTIAYHDKTSMAADAIYKTSVSYDAMYYATSEMNRCACTASDTGPVPYLEEVGTSKDSFDVSAIWPKVAQIDTSIFIVTTASNSDTVVNGEYIGQKLLYYRGYIRPVWGAWSVMVFEDPVQIEDDQIGITCDITAYKGPTEAENEIAMAYIRHDTMIVKDSCYCDSSTFYTHIFDAAALMIRKSNDMGATWSEPDTITEPMAHIYEDYDSFYRGWYLLLDTTVAPAETETVHVYYEYYTRPIDLSITYSPDGVLHAAWASAMLFPSEDSIWAHSCAGACSAYSRSQEIIRHWNDENNKIDTVVIAPIWNIQQPCAGLSHLGHTQEPSVTVDDEGVIYCFWEQTMAQVWWAEDSTCFDISVNGYPNSEIYVAVHHPDSQYWSDPLNITNTYCTHITDERNCVFCSTGTCSSEIEVTVAERVDDYVHISFILDKDPGLYMYRDAEDEPEGEVTLADFMYWRIGREDLIIAAYDTITHAVEENWVTPTPKSFRLGRNYPNPFNAATGFWFDVYTPGHYKIDVVDLLGRTVSNIVDVDIGTGRHHFIWDGLSDNGWYVPSGVYFLRAQDGKGNSVTRKITLVK